MNAPLILVLVLAVADGGHSEDAPLAVVHLDAGEFAPFDLYGMPPAAFLARAQELQTCRGDTHPAPQVQTPQGEAAGPLPGTLALALTAAFLGGVVAGMVLWEQVRRP